MALIGSESLYGTCSDAVTEQPFKNDRNDVFLVFLSSFFIGKERVEDVYFRILYPTGRDGRGAGTSSRQKVSMAGC